MNIQRDDDFIREILEADGNERRRFLARCESAPQTIDPEDRRLLIALARGHHVTLARAMTIRRGLYIFAALIALNMILERF